MTIITPPAQAGPRTYPPGFMAHQRQVFDFLVDHPFAGAWLGIGGGKTLTALRAIQYLRPAGHILVVAPVAIARSTWVDEVAKWNIPIRTRSLIVNDNDKKLSRAKRLERYREVFADPPTMYFINQELVADLVVNMPRRLVGKGAGATEQVVWPFPTVIIDESQAFKSHSSERFEALATVRPAITRLIELTGTPAPNGVQDLWSQVYLLDQGAALGKNITAFRNRWFTAKTHNGIPTKWIPNAGAEEEIHAAIAHLVMSAQNTSLAMPEVTFEDVTITLPKDLMAAYRSFRTELVLDVVRTGVLEWAATRYDEWLDSSTDQEACDLRARLAALSPHEREAAGARDRAERTADMIDRAGADLTATVVAQNQAVLTSKLMQFASGTIYIDPENDPGAFEVVHDEKLAMLEYLVRNTVAVGPDHSTITSGSPVLVAYHFRSDKEQILARLRRAGYRAEAFDGSRDMVRRWNAREIPVMLLHPASAGHGLNLQQGGHTMVWYTLPFSLEHYLQTNGRLHRTGQTEPVTIYRLITAGTQDARMPAVLHDKQQVQDRLIEAVDADRRELAQLADEIADDLNDLWKTTRL